MSKVWETDALIITDKLLRQLNVVDKDDKISFSLCDDIGGTIPAIEIEKDQLELLSDWLACHIKMFHKKQEG